MSNHWLSLFSNALPILLSGVYHTLVFALASMFGGLFLGIPLAIARVLPYRLLNWPTHLYVSLIRGTPLLIQIFLLYYGLPSIGITFSPLVAGILALSLNAAAYLSESLRGTINGVHQGQWNAASSLGLTYFQALCHVILPQALRIAIPAMSNTLISLIKDTSLVSVITVTELMLATKELIAITFEPLPLYLIAALIYWMFSLCFEWLQRELEKKMGNIKNKNT